MENEEHNTSKIESFKRKIDLLTQERNSAVEMWHLAELVADKTKEEIKLLSANNPTDTLQKEIEDMKQDYSDAINMLENKVFTLEKELKHCKEIRSELMQENQLVNSKLQTEMNAREKLERYLKEANEKIKVLHTVIEEDKVKLRQSDERERIARDKVREALESLQEAVENSDALEEEKTKLEEKLKEILDDVNLNSLREIEAIRIQLNSKIDSVSEQLQSVTLEKNKLHLECESVKSEYQVQKQELQMKNKSLLQELNALRNQRQSQVALFHDERNSLRRQLSSLQAELESALLQSRDKEEAPCHECIELQEHVERFSLLCRKWEEAASSVTLNFEKYAQETKQFYQLQEKAYHLQSGLEHT